MPYMHPSSGNVLRKCSGRFLFGVCGWGFLSGSGQFSVRRYPVWKQHGAVGTDIQEQKPQPTGNCPLPALRRREGFCPHRQELQIQPDLFYNTAAFSVLAICSLPPPAGTLPGGYQQYRHHKLHPPTGWTKKHLSYNFHQSSKLTAKQVSSFPVHPQACFCCQLHAEMRKQNE